MAFNILIIACLTLFKLRCAFGELIEVSGQSLENAFVTSVLSSQDGDVFKPKKASIMDTTFTDISEDITKVLCDHSTTCELDTYSGDHRIFGEYSELAEKHDNTYPVYNVAPEQMDIDLVHIDQRGHVRLQNSKMLVVFADVHTRREVVFKIMPYSNGKLLFRLENKEYNNYAARIVAFAAVTGNIYHIKDIKVESWTTQKLLMQRWNKYAKDKTSLNVQGKNDYINRENSYYKSVFDRIKNNPSSKNKIGGNFPLELVKKINEKSFFSRDSTSGGESPKIIEVSQESLENALLSSVLSSDDEATITTMYNDETVQTRVSKNLLANILAKHTEQQGELLQIGTYRGDHRIFHNYQNLIDANKHLNVLPFPHILPKSTHVILEHASKRGPMALNLPIMMIFLHRYRKALKVIPYANGHLLLRLEIYRYKSGDKFNYSAKVVAFVNNKGTIYQVKENKLQLAITPEDLTKEWMEYNQNKKIYSEKGRNKLKDSYLKNIFANVENSVSDETSKRLRNLLQFPISILEKIKTNSRDSTPDKDRGSPKSSRSKSIMSCFVPGSTSGSASKKSGSGAGTSMKK